VYKLLLLFRMRPANQPTKRDVALCHEKVGGTWGMFSDYQVVSDVCVCVCVCVCVAFQMFTSWPILTKHHLKSVIWWHPNAILFNSLDLFGQYHPVVQSNHQQYKSTQNTTPSPWHVQIYSIPLHVSVSHFGHHHAETNTRTKWKMLYSRPPLYNRSTRRVRKVKIQRS
jgi:hypothetical protein